MPTRDSGGDAAFARAIDLDASVRSDRADGIRRQKRQIADRLRQPRERQRGTEPTGAF